MNEDYFNAFGQLAESLDNDMLITGRHVFHHDQISAIVNDIKNKLELNSDNNLLEIGCNIGVILRPLAAEVSSAVGIDHSSCIKKFYSDGLPENIELISGCWPDVSLKQKFDRILVYSVLHYLESIESTYKFIFSCIEQLSDGGKLLIADLPNEDMLQRHQKSTIGKKISQEYKEICDKSVNSNEIEYKYKEEIFSSIENKSFINDDLLTGLVKMIRAENLDAYLLPQPETLPMCFTREDLLICKRD